MKPGDRIREFRTKHRLTLKRMASGLGYSHVYLSNIERGLVDPSREFLKKLNEVYGLSSDFVLYGYALDEVNSFIREAREKVAEYGRMGAIPKASFSDDEIAIIKMLRRLSVSDSAQILKKIISLAESDSNISLSDYDRESLNRLKEIMKRGGRFITGFDFEGLFWGYERVKENLEKKKASDK